MAVKKSAAGADTAVQTYRHEATRKNIPPAGLAGQGIVRESPKLTYAYDPHLPPVLRSDPTGEADKLPELLEIARTRKLTDEEARVLADALRNRQPWLEWAGKHEKKAFAVDPVALHIHERISAQAILKVAARENVQRSLFADPEQSYREAIQFYQHDVDWANRMILGDSLQVMASLARREDVAGKVQMIYLDPPYGIKFASNFQPEVGKRDVKDKDSDLTREPEMVKAYRDTWTLGVHSYLAYLRDRLLVARELLAPSGSIFVQISDENLHRVRVLMDEVFGPENFASLITFSKTAGATVVMLPSTADYILWYCKDKQVAKFRRLYSLKAVGGEGAEKYDQVELSSGERRTITGAERGDTSGLPEGARVYRLDNLTSQSVGRQKGEGAASWFPVNLDGRQFLPNLRNRWKTNEPGMARLVATERLQATTNSLAYRRFINDFPAYAISNVWTDIGGIQSRSDPKVYVVQTATEAIKRCILMSTDPSDLVLDPTCGSGTTAYVAEQWGRRWVTIDTSRVALALARQRLLTASFPFYRVKDGDDTNPSHGFVYRTVPHITLKSIAQNTALDGVAARHQQALDRKLAALNDALRAVMPATRQQLAANLATIERQQGKRAVTEADRRRWLLPKQGWQEWEVPFDADPDWPHALQEALTAYRQAWRAKLDEVNAAIAANAEQEELVDQPEVVRGVVRVSGPFTMEAVMPAEESLGDSPIAGGPDELDTFGQTDGEKGAAAEIADEPVNAEAYLDKMLRLLRTDGLRFPNNKVLRFTRLDAASGGIIHAEGDWETEDGHPRSVAVSFGPEYGPITATQVEEALPRASRQGFQDLVFAGFSFDGAAQAVIQDDPNPRVRCHLAHIRPDVNMGGLLKETPNNKNNQQIFTVFGSPRTELRATPDGQYTVEMQGVDIYNPVDNTILPTNADKVAAWFVDGDYDGYTFCITQAFFPDKTAWAKLARALKGVADEERFAALSGTTSLPFPAGKHKRVAVKVMDPRGNEVMRVQRLDGTPTR
jgi:adenine-specific DNA-methyltransferase